MVKQRPAMWETQIQSLGRDDPLEVGMATPSRILAWKNPSPWTEEPGRLQSMGSWRVRHDWNDLVLMCTRTHTHTHTHTPAWRVVLLSTYADDRHETKNARIRGSRVFQIAKQRSAFIKWKYCAESSRINKYLYQTFFFLVDLPVLSSWENVCILEADNSAISSQSTNSCCQQLPAP